MNILSVVSLAPMPVFPSYSISKAAALSLTQSLRPLLKRQGVSVQAVILGSVDTDMSRGFDIPKVWIESAAVGIFDDREKRGRGSYGNRDNANRQYSSGGGGRATNNWTHEM